MVFYLHVIIACNNSAFDNVESDSGIVVELAMGMLAPTLPIADGWRIRENNTKSNTAMSVHKQKRV